VLEAAPATEGEAPWTAVNTSSANIDAGTDVTVTEALDVTKTHIYSRWKKVSACRDVVYL
jgi:hypothetical protein